MYDKSANVAVDCIRFCGVSFVTVVTTYEGQLLEHTIVSSTSTSSCQHQST